MRIDLSRRITLEGIGILFFGSSDIVGCVSGEYSPKSWQWRKLDFKIKEHGGLLSYLMFNGVFERKSELLMWKFFERYIRRITGLDKKPRQCFTDRINDIGLTYALIYSTYAYVSDQHLYLSRESLKQYPIIERVFYDKPLYQKEHFTIKCHQFDFVTEVYKQLHTEFSKYVKTTDTEPEILAKVIKGELDVYDVVFSFNDVILVGATLRVLTTSRPTKKIISKVEKFLTDYYENQLEQPDKVREVVNRYHHLLSEVK